MGRRAGSKNYGNMSEEPSIIVVSESERERLPEIFTCVKKDFISISDLMDMSGLGYDMCAKIIREIKAISDTFHISGIVHRTDYYLYNSRKFTVPTDLSAGQKAAETAGGNLI